MMSAPLAGPHGRTAASNQGPRAAQWRVPSASRSRAAWRASLTEAKAIVRCGTGQSGAAALSTLLVCRDGEHLVHDADDGVRGGGDEALAEEACPTDADAHHARGEQPEERGVGELYALQPRLAQLARHDADEHRGQHRERVRVEHGRPQALERQARDEELAVGELEDEHLVRGRARARV